MIKGIHTAGAALQPMMSRMEVIANNLANLNTRGYKKDDIFARALDDAAKLQAEGRGDFAGLDVRQYTDFAEGSIAETHQPLDLAIQGEGFFVVESPHGWRYTRNGNFRLEKNGALVTGTGHPVIGLDGPLHVEDSEKSATDLIRVTPTGEILLGTKPIGTVMIVRFADLTLLQKEGDTMFSSIEVPVRVESSSTIVRQGFLEESNVDGLQELIAMVELARSFESSQRAIQSQDALAEKTLDIGRFQ
jgi:flagellar basal-body rod protein FlgF